MKILIPLSIFVFFACIIITQAIIFPWPDNSPREFLVSLKDNATCDDNTTQALRDVIKEKGGIIREDYCNSSSNGTSLMKGFLVYGKKSLQDFLSSNKDKYQIEQVSKNDDFVILQNSSCVTQSFAPWCLARTSGISPLNLHFKYPSSAGEGVTLYYLDTGVKVDHKEFEGRVTRGGTHVAGEDDNDNQGHGTGTMSMGLGKTYGVAKKANGIMVKVCDRGGKCKPSNVLKGLQEVADKCVQSGKSVCILNMSLGGKKNMVINDAVAKAMDFGVLPVIAAGNSRNDACDNSPASYPKAITVGATTELNTLSPTSARGPCVDMLAPGTNCLMASNKGDLPAISSGTSFAAPLVAGNAALLLGEDPSLTADELTEKIIEDSVKNGIIILQIPFITKPTPNRFVHVKC